MARRKDFISSFLSAVEKEARRAAKEQERINRLQERELQRQATLYNNRVNTSNEATKAISVIAERPSVEYLSLANSNYKGLPSDLIILDEAVNNLKIGKRIDAILCYKEHTDLEYNDIIDTIKYLEANLNHIIGKRPQCYFKDLMGKYEFTPLNELITHKQLDSYDKIELELNCKPLHIKEIISSKNPAVIQNKASASVKKISAKWYKEFCSYHATRENVISEQLLNESMNILNYSLCNGTDLFEWENLKDDTEFQSCLTVVEKPVLKQLKDIELIENNIKEQSELIFKPELYNKNIIENIINLFGLKNTSDKLYQKRLADIKNEWEETKSSKIKNLKKTLEDAVEFNKNVQKEFEDENFNYDKYLKALNNEKDLFLNKQKEYNENIDKLIDKYNNKDENVVADFFEYVLEQSVYPILYNKDYSVEFNSINNILEVNYILPNLEDIPNIKTINHVGAKDNFKILYMTEKQHSEFYDKVIYQICFRTIYEVFTSDNKNYIDSVVFNGYTRSIDKKDGQLKTICIMSVQTSKNDFMALNLANIDPKACFKSLKGVAAIELASLTPIKPILKLNKDDKRFIDAYEVMEDIQEGYNLATMDWQDFENLVREIFEKEFSQNGGEVKVTQSSRDGGVDAIAFDPDPIRGGKIVIQAKRYTNVVGVANVRDLYGTVMNEGAIKGILVTTSDYGADSYEFAKDKPLTLLNGGHLLHLLEKHGHHARIDLQEAKIINKELSK